MLHLGTSTREGKIIQVSNFKLLMSKLPFETPRERIARFLMCEIRKAQFPADRNRTTPKYKKKKKNCPRHFHIEQSFVFSLFTPQFYFLKAYDKNRVIKCACYRRLENHLVPLYEVSESTKVQIMKGIWGGGWTGD